MDRQDIIDFKEYMLERHSQRLKEQIEDQQYLENNYPLKLIKKVDYQMRSNFAARMINGVTQQVISKLPKVYFTANEDNATAMESCKKLSKLVNRWIKKLLEFPANPFEQAFKTICNRGEYWIYNPHNALLANYDGDWRQDYPYMMPVEWVFYDPMVVFADPSEEVNGQPKRVLVSYKRTIGDIKAHYPKWTAGKNRSDKEPVDFDLYFDGNVSYAEAEEEPLFRDAKGKLIEYRKNIYGCMPFAHVYSGWGQETQERKPDLLAYSRVRMIRDLIAEDSSVRSDMMYNFHSFAHVSKTIYVPAGAELAEDWNKSYNNDPDKLNVVYLPEGANRDDFKTEDSQLFDAPAFAYADRIRADLSMEYPAPLHGISGTSGRQQDMGRSSALAVYDCAVNSVIHAWELALGSALRVMSTDGLDLMPDGVSKDDLSRYKDITIDMRSEDPVERDRQITMGSAQVQQGLKSLHTFLVEDRRLTEEEADEEEINIMADRYIQGNPIFAQFIAYMAAQKSGMGQELQQFQQLMGEQGAGGNVMTSQIGSKGGEPRRGNIKTETGMEMVDVSNSAYGQRVGG